MNQKTFIIVIVVVVVVLCLLCGCGAGAYFLISRNGNNRTNIDLGQTDIQTPQVQQPGQEPAVEASPMAAAPEEQTWLVMLYQDADDEVLERDIFLDLNEAEVVGSSDRVEIVAQLDRFNGAFDGDGNWTETHRYHITQDNDLETISSEEVQDLGEVNMGAADSIVDFATWAIATYPADNYVLILSDHGTGWVGGWTDNDPVQESMVYLNEIDAALGQIVSRSGIDKFEMVGMDACLMAQMEVATALAPYARYAVLSEETEPSLGWAYAAFLGRLSAAPEMSGADLARAIVETYINEDQRIVDPQARKDYLYEAYEYTDEATAQEVIDEVGVDVTLSAVDLQALPDLNAKLNALAYQMTLIDSKSVAYARSYAQSFANVFDPDLPPSYLDLKHFALLVAEQAAAPAIDEAVNNLNAALDKTLIAERHGAERPGANGMAIYFPNSDLYQTDYAGYDAYVSTADRFANESQWDDFLVYYYTGQTFEPDATGAVTPVPSNEITSPGGGEFEIAPLTAAPTTIGSGQSVNLQTEIRGENIGYVYLLAGYHDTKSDTYLAIDTDYILASQTHQVGGVTYPDWGDSGKILVNVDWVPTLYYLNDGKNREMVVLYPTQYGTKAVDTVYSVDGTYTFAKSGDRRYAVLNFDSKGKLLSIYAYNSETSNVGTPREVSSKKGDKFTIRLKALKPDAQGNPKLVQFEGGTITFGAKKPAWESAAAGPGAYLVGIVVTDLDGQYKVSYVPVTVR